MNVFVVQFVFRYVYPSPPPHPLILTRTCITVLQHCMCTHAYVQLHIHVNTVPFVYSVHAFVMYCVCVNHAVHSCTVPVVVIVHNM